MNAYKSLVTAIAAAAVVGTVGFVSAQTTSSDPAAAPQTQTYSAPANTAAADNAPVNNAAPQADNTTAAAQAPAAMPAPRDTAAAPMVSADSSQSAAEPMPKADRN